MLRSRFAVWSCLALLSPGSAWAEAVKAEPAPVHRPATATKSGETGQATDQKSSAPNADKSVAATEDGNPAIGAAATATAPSAAAQPAANEAAKAAEPAKPAPPPTPTLTAAIDLAQQKMVVSEGGKARYTWPISSGTSEFPTPRGTFHPQWTAKMWYSRKYDNAPMPHAVFINGGVAVHATFHTGSLGRPASHGCIRLSPSNAKTFYGLVQRHGLKMTKVSVYGTPKWSAPAVASRNENRQRRYAQRQDDTSGFWGGSSSYKTTSAYDPGFTQKRRYRKPAQAYYYYPGDAPTPRVYRRYGDQRYVYVQRPQRRVYYYNNSGYGYGGGW